MKRPTACLLYTSSSHETYPDKSPLNKRLQASPCLLSSILLTRGLSSIENRSRSVWGFSMGYTSIPIANSTNTRSMNRPASMVLSRMLPLRTLYMALPPFPMGFSRFLGSFLGRNHIIKNSLFQKGEIDKQSPPSSDKRVFPHMDTLAQCVFRQPRGLCRFFDITNRFHWTTSLS